MFPYSVIVITRFLKKSVLMHCKCIGYYFFKNMLETSNGICLLAAQNIFRY